MISLYTAEEDSTVKPSSLQMKDQKDLSKQAMEIKGGQEDM